jgi:hypothetical protein
LAVESPVRSLGAVRAWWSGLPAFWRLQIVGWGLFAFVDLLNQQLIYHDFFVAIVRTAVVVACLVLLSAACARSTARGSWATS